MDKAIMMKCILVLMLAISMDVNAQSANQKIKVILLGTFHYGATSDRNSTAFADLYSPQRQKQLDSIADALNRAGVNKYFLETHFTRQRWQDSLYNLYLAGKLNDTANDLRDERVQIAFRAAAKSKAALVAADFRQELPYDKMNEYEEAHKNDSISAYPFFDVPYPFTAKQPKLRNSSLLQYYVQLNNLYNRQAHLYDYLHYAPGYGADSNYVGESFALSWYDRNLKIYTNILRNIDSKKDKVIVVLFGSSHTAVLRQFFEAHPYFEIVELNRIFK
jgi:Family of unknown function (DUF5694)